MLFFALLFFAASTSLADPSGGRDSLSRPFHAWIDGRLNLGMGEYQNSQSQVRNDILWNGLISVPVEYKAVDGKVSVGLWRQQYPRSASNEYRSRNAFYALEFDECWIRVPFHLREWPMALTAGSLRWRDNPQAALGGEYLARYSAYPPAPVRDGQPWDPLDTLSTSIIGLQFSVGGPQSIWTHQAEVFLDSTGSEWQISAAYSLGFKPSPKFNLGLGVEELGLAGPWPETLSTPGKLPTPDGAVFVLDSNSTPDTITEYYHSTPAYLLSLRGAVDLSRVLFSDPDSSHAWSLYAEAALLGIENQGRLYAQPLDRVAGTVGMSFPTLHVFKSLRLQWERIPVPQSLWIPAPLTGNIIGVPGIADVSSTWKAVRSLTFSGSVPILSWLEVSGFVQSRTREMSNDVSGPFQYLFGNSFLNFQLRLVGRSSFFRR